LARADRLEKYWRDFAFLGLPEELNIAGQKVVVRLLTLRMFVQLCAVNSPFFVGGRIGPEHVLQILWRLSPKYDTRLGNPSARQQFIESIALLPYAATLRAVNRYLDRMLIDKPPTIAKKNGVRPDTSFAASAIHQLASAYGWSDEQILDLPMPRVFQYMRKIHREANHDLAYFNPIRDRFVKKITSKVLAARKEKRNVDKS
jgi:hypothetical protein